MIDGAGLSRSRSFLERVRPWLLGAGMVAELVVLAPPVGDLARRYVSVEALQFAVLGIVVPGLVVLAAPWSLRRGRPPRIDRRGDDLGIVVLAAATRWADARLHHRSLLRSVGFLLLSCGATIVWRVPAVVNALQRSWGLSLLEAVSLLVTGVLLWLEIVPSPPFTPRCAYPSRIGIVAVAMWTIWTIAYLLGLSHAAWFAAYRHSPGSGLSVVADQQLAAGILWVIPAAAYIPVIFASLITWLSNSEDPDDELRQIVRDERRRSLWSVPRRGRSDGGPGQSPH